MFSSRDGASWGRSKRRCVPLRSRRLATWNVEGIHGDSQVKLEELCIFMRLRDVDILCIQETHKFGAEYFYVNGYMVCLSGSRSGGQTRSNAGVGFIVAPRARPSIISFKASSDRLASLKVKTPGGNITLLSFYAPHSAYSYEIRQRFFNELSAMVRPPTNHSAYIILGDFNAKLGRRMQGEEDIIGPYVFESPFTSGDPATSNRALLIECCIANSLMVANTQFDLPDENKISYRGLTTKPQDQVTYTKFAQIDHVLCHQAVWQAARACSTDRLEALNSHHFVTILDLQMEFDTGLGKQGLNAIDLASLRDPDVYKKFGDAFQHEVSQSNVHSKDLDGHAETVNDAFMLASSVVPKMPMKKRRPWISARTVGLIESRNACRHNSDYELEKQLNKEVRKAARADRREWLLQELSGGSWSAVRKLRQGPRTMHASVKNMEGELMPTDQRAETLAEYFEKVQWQDPFPNKWPEASEPLGPTLPIKTSDITAAELQEALRKLSAGKAGGSDGIPPDFWKHLAWNTGACGTLLQLCQRCWAEKSLPDSWRQASVVLLFKKGDTSLPANYRPIALLPVGYKVLASILHSRLLEGGAEERMHATQYGFRPKRGTSDALMVVRRMIDAAHQSRNGSLHLLMLDWAKAFDRVKPASMSSALSRFGLPEDMCEMISSIYSTRFFKVKDHTGESSTRRQMTGIAQGCPLSPYLFIAVQTVMLHDVYKDVKLGTESSYVVTRDVLYADDTFSSPITSAT